MPATDPPARTRAHPLRALRARNFRLFYAGQLVSLVGTWMQSVAQSWLVYRLTGSEALLGLVGFAGQIPVFALAPLGGALADRYPKRTLVVITQAASMLLAATLAVLTLAGVVQVAHLFMLAVLLGVVNAVDMPTRQAFVVEMVSRDDLMNAIALNSSIFNAARFLGPAVAGLVVAAVGEGVCFALNAASYLAVIAGLLAMRDLPPPNARAGRSPLAEIAEGFLYVGGAAPIRSLLFLLGALCLFGLPYLVLMPVFADRVLGGGVRELGWLMAAAGFGALVGALDLARRAALAGLDRSIALAAAAFGVMLLGFAASRSLPLSLAFAIGAGYCMMRIVPACNSLIQWLVDDRLRGRVMAVYTMTIMGAAPVGALLGGMLAERVGAPATVAGGGVVSLCAAAVFARHLPRFRAGAQALRARLDAQG